MYESRHQPLLSHKDYLKRLWNNMFFCMFILFISLLIGLVGFHFINHNSWIDSLHNASMLLGGMGPVVEMTSNGAKIFSSAYAIFSGVVFITNIGLFFAPMVHRIFHRFHLQDDGKSS